MEEKRFCKVGEYSKKLPNPRVFPIQGADIVAVKGCPNTFSDGFILDLSVSEKVRQKLEKLVTRTTDKSLYDTLIGTIPKTTILLSEPVYVYDAGYTISYVLFTPNKTPVAIQVKYYRYFRNRYKGCQFYTSDVWTEPKSVKVEDKAVGLWMPTMTPSIPKKVKGE